MSWAMKLSTVSNIYRNDNVRFVAEYLAWLEAAEKDLSTIRSPLCVILQSEKNSLLSVLDGYLPDYILAGTNPRKAQRAVAAHSVDTISKEIYSKIGEIDQNLAPLGENLARAVAVLMGKDPHLFDAITANQDGVDAIWRRFATEAETVPIYNYMCAKLSRVDVNYLLIDIIQNVLSSR
jgi:hypothetical protein